MANPVSHQAATELIKVARMFIVGVDNGSFIAKTGCEEVVSSIKKQAVDALAKAKQRREIK